MGACIEYAANPAKTVDAARLAESLGYIADGDKTAEARYVSALNCSAQNAFEQMSRTKERFGKTSRKIQGYHLISSYEPGEIAPEQAHKLGRELAARLFPEYEVVIATHIDKDHVHNHIVLNSVNIITGAIFNNPNGFLEKIRRTSNEISREYGYSVVRRQRGGAKSKIEYTDPDTGERVTKEAKGRSRTRSEWNANTQRKPTVRSKVRADIDEIIKRSSSWGNFIENLRKSGYTIRQSQGELKHFAIRTPSGTRLRLDSLGEGYSETEIKARIASASYSHYAPKYIKHKRAKLKGVFPTRLMTKSFRALYFRYLYALGKIPAKGIVRTRTRTSRFLAPEVKKLNELIAQERFLRTHKLNTYAELSMFSGAASDEIYRITRERKPLYELKRFADKQELHTPADVKMFADAVGEDIYVLAAKRKTLRAEQYGAAPDDAERISTEISKLTAKLKTRYYQRKMCSRILASGYADIGAAISAMNAAIKERRQELSRCRRIEKDSKEMEKKLDEARDFARQPPGKTQERESEKRQPYEVMQLH